MTESKQLPAIQQSSSLFAVPLQEMKQIADLCVESGYFEGANKPAQAMIKIMKGHDLGMTPMEAMESIYVFKGKTGLHANLVAARIKGSMVYDYEFLEKTEDVCRLKFTKNGKPLEGEAKFTYKEAVDAGYVESNRKQYSANRENMLFNRAVMRGYRAYCPEIFRLPIYSREELDEIVDAEKVTTVSKNEAEKDAAAQMLENQKKRRAGKQQLRAAEPEAPQEAPQEDITDVQSQPVEPQTPPTVIAEKEAGVKAPDPSAPKADGLDPLPAEMLQQILEVGKANGWTESNLAARVKAGYGVPSFDLLNVGQGRELFVICKNTKAE